MKCRCEFPEKDNWLVLRRNYNRSAFNGYRDEWSAFSDVRCVTCGSHWRTKAKYVDELVDDPEWIKLRANT